MSWAWPQYVIALYLVFEVAFGSVRLGRDREMSSGTATTAILIHVALHLGLAAVLAAGGFW